MTTQSQHTPGPWRSEDFGINVFAPNGRIVARVLVDGLGREQRAANAALIAASPAMLAALEAVDAFFDLNDRTKSWGRASAASSWEAARAAVALARGEVVRP